MWRILHWTSTQKFVLSTLRAQFPNQNQSSDRRHFSFIGKSKSQLNLNSTIEFDQAEILATADYSKVGLHSIHFLYVRKTHPLFLCRYMLTVYAHPFFCRPDESASANFTCASSRALLYFGPLPYVFVELGTCYLKSSSAAAAAIWQKKSAALPLIATQIKSCAAAAATTCMQKSGRCRYLKIISSKRNDSIQIRYLMVKFSSF